MFALHQSQKQPLVHRTCLIKTEMFVNIYVELLYRSCLFQPCCFILLLCSMPPSASITECIVSVSNQILVCLVVEGVVFFPPSIFFYVPVIASRVKGRTEESIETEAPSTARPLHAILSHVKLSLVAQWHQQWPKTAAPQKHSHAFHARLPQKCCAEIDTLFDVLLPAVNWEEHLWPFWSPGQSPKCSSLLNRSVADAKQ